MHKIKKEVELKHIEGDEIEINFEMEENPIKTTSIVVTATRGEKIYEDLPIKVSTINENDFRISSSNNLRESLQYQPGVRTEVNCQNCGFSQVRINGLEGKYSQILIDGKAVFSTLNGVYGLEQIPTNMIDRIEIIRGGGSSLYGGNAVAGVINVITKEPCENSYSIRWDNLLVKSKMPENTISLNATILNDEQNLGLTMFGMSNDRHEYDANSDGFTEIGRMNVKNLGSKFFWKLSPHSKLLTGFHFINHEIRGGDSLDLQPHEANIAEYAKHITYLGQASYIHYFEDGNKIKLDFSMQNTNRNSYYGSNRDLNAYGKTTNTTISAGGHYSHLIDNLLGYHIMTMGYEFNKDVMNDMAPAYQRNINQNVISNGFFFQDDWNINNNISLIWGLRLDKHNLIDNLIFNPRASLLYKPIDDLSLRTTYSTGYRAPQAFDEDLHITQVGGVGLVILLDKNLKPEYSHSFSVSADLSARLFNLPIAFSLEFFSSTLNDVFILEDNGFDNIGNRQLLRKNGKSAIVQGITFETFCISKNELSVKFGLTYQKSIYNKLVEWSEGNAEKKTEPQYSDKIFRTPDLYGYFLASLSLFEGFNIDISGIYTGQMYVPHYSGYIENDILIKSKPFFDLNIKISFRVISNPNIDLSLGVLNILDAYQDDFDKGMNRDAGYIYGPFRPLTSLFSIKISS